MLADKFSNRPTDFMLSFDQSYLSNQRASVGDGRVWEMAEWGRWNECGRWIEWGRRPEWGRWHSMWGIGRVVLCIKYIAMTFKLWCILSEQYNLLSGNYDNLYNTNHVHYGGHLLIHCPHISFLYSHKIGILLFIKTSEKTVVNLNISKYNSITVLDMWSWW